MKEFVVVGDSHFVDDEEIDKRKGVKRNVESHKLKTVPFESVVLQPLIRRF